MNNKKVLQVAAAATLITTSFAAINPAQTEAATNTESLVAKAEANKVILQRAISIEYKADAVTQPWAEYNKAKKDYQAALTAVSKVTGKQKTLMNARLAEVKLWIDRTAAYIDSITSGQKLLAVQEEMETYLYDGQMEEATAAYHQLSYQIKKQANSLYKVYGQSTRQAILDTYKAPAEAAKELALYPVSIYIELDRLATALLNDDVEKAEEHVTLIAEWIEYVEDPGLYELLVNIFMETYSEYYNPVIVEVTGDSEFSELSTGESFDEFSLLHYFTYYDDKGEMAWVDPTEYGYTLRDNKGYFNSDGTLKAIYADGLPKSAIGTVEVEVLLGTEVVATQTFTIVDGDQLYSLDAGKLVDSANADVESLTVGQSYQFVPTEAWTIRGDFTSETGRTITLADFPGVTFKSSKPSVFTVDENGTVTAVSKGYARLIVSWKDNEVEMMLKVN